MSTQRDISAKPVFTRYSGSQLPPSLSPIPKIHPPTLSEPTPSPDPVKSQAPSPTVLPTFESLDISDWTTTPDWIAASDLVTPDYFPVDLPEPIVTETDSYPEGLAIEPNADANYKKFKYRGPLPKKPTRSPSPRVTKPSANGTLVRSPCVSRKAQPTPINQVLARAHLQGLLVGAKKVEHEVPVVKFQRCFHCVAYFISAQDLVDHVRATHT